MDKDEIIGRLRMTAAVAVIRVDDSKGLVDVADALIRGGIDFVEITLTVPGAIAAIRECDQKLGTRVIVGAGTVLNTQSAEAAIEAGAKFIVSPSTDPEVIKTSVAGGTLVVPGALTPTEVVRAKELGAGIVKIFSARIGGPRYLQDLKGPFPEIELLPTGGITIENAPDFLAAGAIAVGIGGDLASRAAVRNGDFEQIFRNAKRLRSVIDEYRAKSQ